MASITFAARTSGATFSANTFDTTPWAPSDGWIGSGLETEASGTHGNSIAMLPSNVPLDLSALGAITGPITGATLHYAVSGSYATAGPGTDYSLGLFGAVTKTQADGSSWSATGSLDVTADFAGVDMADLLTWPSWAALIGPGGTIDNGVSVGLTIASLSITFIYTPPGPPPTPPGVTSVSPASGDVAGGTAVTIKGTGLGAATDVRFDGVLAAGWALVDDATITAPAPPHAAGPVTVKVAGVGSLPAAFTYTYALTAQISATLPKNLLPPVPTQSPIAGDSGVLGVDYTRWLTVVKQRIESLLPASGFTADLSMKGSPVVPWDSVLKAGSSLADLETTNAGDLAVGTLRAARMPALTGDVTSAVGTVATVLADGVVTNTKVATLAAIAWSKISKVGSSLADLATRSAADLTSGLLALARGGLGFDASGIAKGGLVVGTGAGTAGLKAVGADATILTADAASTGGVKWAAAAVGFSPAQAEAYISLRIL